MTEEFMPHNAANIPVEINFLCEIEKIMCYGNSRSDHLSLNTLILACMNNSYVYETAMITGISGQPLRNHIRDKDPDGLLQINQNLIRTMRVFVVRTLYLPAMIAILKPGIKRMPGNWRD